MFSTCLLVGLYSPWPTVHCYTLRRPSTHVVSENLIPTMSGFSVGGLN